MNERIRELVLEAEHGNYGRMAFGEKLAELIVRECAKYVDEMWPHQKEFKGTLDVGKGLKAKFGVKE